MKKHPENALSKATGSSVPVNDSSRNDSTDITSEERKLLDTAGQNEEENRLHEATLDNTDEEGDELNENTSDDSTTGNELDVPGSEEDDADEEIGEEDEENNVYSLGGEKKD